MLACALVLAGQAGAHAGERSSAPVHMTISALVDGQWQLYYRGCDRAAWQPLETTSEPRTPAISPDGRHVAYVAVDGSIHEVNAGNGAQRTLLDSTPGRGLTQPAYASRHRLVAVLLKDGNSVDTDIVAVDGATLQPVLAQRSAQFEPHFSAGENPSMYYSNVLCTLPCGQVIQEIWRFRIASGVAAQVTQLNAVSRQPHVDTHGTLYFSSNRDGYYHIWRQSPDGAPERLTGGAVNDSQPAVADDGSVWFLRQSASGIALMRLPPGSDAPVAVALPFKHQNLKDLRIRR